jgi:microcystin-dependent protein
VSALPIIVTSAGRAAIVNAENTGTAPVTIAEIGLTATAFVASEATAALPGEIKRVDTLSGEVVADDTIHITISDDSADTYELRGLALYLDDGTLFASYGQADPIMEKSAQAIVLIATDIKFVDVTAESITFGDSGFTNPPATEARAGVVELADDVEAANGTDGTRAISPLRLKPLLDAKAAAAHGHTTADIAGLVAILAGLSAVGHTHDAAAIVSGVLALARIPALPIAQTTGLQAILDGKASTALGTTAAAGLARFATNAEALAGLLTNAAISPATLAYVMQFAIPAGMPAYFAGATPPTGWLVRDGSAVSRATYAALFAAIGTTYGAGDGATTFNLPDGRGEFDRGWDAGRGIDVGRALGSWQAGMVEAHTHGLPSEAGGSLNIESLTNTAGSDERSIGSGVTGSYGGVETRPRNVAFLPVIKF